MSALTHISSTNSFLAKAFQRNKLWVYRYKSMEKLLHPIKKGLVGQKRKITQKVEQIKGHANIWDKPRYTRQIHLGAELVTGFYIHFSKYLCLRAEEQLHQWNRTSYSTLASLQINA